MARSAFVTIVSSDAPARKRRIATWRVLGALLVLSALGLARAFSRVASPFGAVDLHPYWYAGHALRQGLNPYQPGLARVITLPVSYLDGTVTTAAPLAQPGLGLVPPNTAPLSLLLFASAWLSWPWAKWLWLGVNLGLALLLPRLLLRAFPQRRALTRLDQVWLHLLFLTLAGTRMALWTGQTTLLVFALMLGALIWRERNGWVAGAMLGVALCKYSLALPAFLVFCLSPRRRDWSIAALALTVQLLGLLAVAALSHSAPLVIAQGYWRIFQYELRTTQDVGVQLALLLPAGGWLRFAAQGALIAAVGGTVLTAARRREAFDSAIRGYALWVILLLGTLLATYHGSYDTALAIAFVPLWLMVQRQPEHWRLSPHQGRWVLAIGLVTLALLMAPGSVVSEKVAGEAASAWSGWFTRGVTLALLLQLTVCLWLLPRGQGEGPARGSALAE